MRRTVFGALAALVLVPLLLAGCGSTRSTAPASFTAQQNADDMAIQAVLSLGVTGGDINGAYSSTPPAAPQRIATGTTLRHVVTPARAQWDTSYTAGDFTFEASRVFYDALDAPLAGWTPLAVRVHWTSRAYGTHSTVIDTTTIGHAAAIDLRGIQSGQDTVTVDGACNDTLQNVFHSLDGLRKRYFHWQSGTSIAGVRILKSQVALGGGPVPIGGTVTCVVSADRLRSNNVGDVEAHLDAIVVVTFNGTTTPLITVDGTYHYLWHLDTGQITRA
jgi:hypothetical protein